MASSTIGTNSTFRPTQSLENLYDGPYSTVEIDLNCSGNTAYSKLSYPVKYGQFSRLETDRYIFEFNLNHEIKHAKSKHKNWIHPSEWLKRTMGNDWIYYSSGGYAGVFEALGEYYLPNLEYPTNSLIGGKPFREKEISHIIENYHHIINGIPEEHLSKQQHAWLQHIKENTPANLQRKANHLFGILGSRVSVLPPDTRHVDYNIIPIMICDGCLYKCKFCKIKNKKAFSVRTSSQINDQISRLKQLFATDLSNYNSIYLGDHDALNAPGHVILKTLQSVSNSFKLNHSYMKNKHLFMFGSVDSLINKDLDFFKELDRSSFLSFINVGLESYDQTTLDFLGKPLETKQIKAAFEKIQMINDSMRHIEITSNFVMDGSLSPMHYDSVMTLLRQGVNRMNPKGNIYFSPLKFSSPSREALYDFYRLKALSRFPTYLYIIQRL